MSALLAASLLLSPQLEWRDEWRRFSTVEYVATGTLLAIDFTILLAVRAPPSRTHGGWLFDDASRGWLRGDEESTRLNAQAWSDRFYFGMYVFGVLGAPTAALVRGRSAISWQLLMMNAEAFALTGFVQAVLSNVVGRERPFATHCTADDHTWPCSETGGRTQSFISGHTAMAATGAGLTCAHHQQLGLWANDAADVTACAVSVLAAGAVGALRIVGDKHWTTDVVLGMGLGLTVGYGLPNWLHYRSAPKVAVLPQADAHSAGLGLLGVW